jgi:hypothetical protein
MVFVVFSAVWWANHGPSMPPTAAEINEELTESCVETPIPWTFGRHQNF